MRSFRPRAWPLLALLVVTACGPTIPLDAGVAVRGIDVFFGVPQPSPPPPPPLPPFANPNPNFPSPLEMLMPDVGSADVQGSCPPLSPLAYPALKASFDAPTRPPALAVYPYRFVGTVTKNAGKPTQKVIHVDSDGTRQVSGATKPDKSGAYQFTVVQNWNGGQTTMTFGVQPAGPAGSVGSGYTPAAGIYLVQMTDDQGDVFNPNPPGVEVMAFPAINSNTWSSSATDPVHQTTMDIFDPTTVKAPPPPSGVPGSAPPAPYGGQALGEVRVNACGKAVDSVQVKLVGKLVNSQNSSQEKDFVLTFFDATQYGGLIVSDHLQESGTDAVTGQPFAYDVTATINTVPKAGT